MAFAAAQLREQIESALAQRGSARLVLAPRLVCPGFETGYGVLDAVLRGGLPVAGTTEIVGSRSSGRTSLAAACVAERTREGHVCAWVDVSAEMDAEACLANGAELDRLLVVRCSAAGDEVKEPAAGPILRLVPEQPKPERKPTNLFARHKVKPGTPSAPNRSLACERVEQVASDRQPARRGMVVLEPKPAAVQAIPGAQVAANGAKKPWTRLDQGIRAVDLLVQAGGFGAIVFDLGSIAPQFARRIPLATWFRWRAACERSRDVADRAFAGGLHGLKRGACAARTG